MEIIIPEPYAVLEQTSSPGTYVYLLWTVSTYFAANVIIRYSVGGVMRDYRCKVSHTSASWNAPPYASHWELVGPSSVTTSPTYATNIRYSNYDQWVQASIPAGYVFLDNANNHDYRSLVAMTAQENSIRPSEAVLSGDETVRSRWLDLGAANAFAPLDYMTNSYLEGYANSGSSVSTVQFTIIMTSSVNAVDRVILGGVKNTSQVTISVLKGAGLTVHHTETKSMIPSGNTFGSSKGSVKFSFTAIPAGTLIRVIVALTRYAASAPARMGPLMVGRAVIPAGTEWGVETSIIPFSTKERDETYGTVKFVRRGTARQVKATCFIDTSIVAGDVVQELLDFVEGQPMFWDFNDNGTDYDRLRVFGFYTNMRIIIQAATYESLSIDIEGLVK